MQEHYLAQKIKWFYSVSCYCVIYSWSSKYGQVGTLKSNNIFLNGVPEQYSKYYNNYTTFVFLIIKIHDNIFVVNLNLGENSGALENVCTRKIILDNATCTIKSTMNYTANDNCENGTEVSSHCYV